jgi:hypothetical protein
MPRDRDDNSLLTLSLPIEEMNLHQISYVFVELGFLTYIVGRRTELGESSDIGFEPFALNRRRSAQLTTAIKCKRIRSGSLEVDLQTSANVAQIIEAVLAVIVASWTAFRLRSPIPIRLKQANIGTRDEAGRLQIIESILQEEVMRGGSRQEILARAMVRIGFHKFQLTKLDFEQCAHRIDAMMDLFD